MFKRAACQSAHHWCRVVMLQAPSLCFKGTLPNPLDHLVYLDRFSANAVVYGRDYGSALFPLGTLSQYIRYIAYTKVGSHLKSIDHITVYMRYFGGNCESCMQ